MIRLTFEVSGDRAVIGRLTGMTQRVYGALEVTITRLVYQLSARVRAKLQGPVLKHRTGALSASIKEVVQANPGSIVGRVFSDGSVKYARIHEFGGVIHHPGGTAYFTDRATGLARFISNARATPAMPRTRPHAIPMPERSFLRSSLTEMVQQIRDAIDKAARAAAKE